MSDRDRQFEARLLASASTDGCDVDEQVAWARFATRTASVAALIDATSGVHSLPATTSPHPGAAMGPSHAHPGFTGATSAVSTRATSSASHSSIVPTASGGGFAATTASTLAAGATDSIAGSATGAGVGAGTAIGTKLLAPVVLKWVGVGSVLGAIATSSGFLLLTPRLPSPEHELGSPSTVLAGKSPVRAPDAIVSAMAELSQGNVESGTLTVGADETDDGAATPTAADERDEAKGKERSPRPGSKPASEHHTSTPREAVLRAAASEQRDEASADVAMDGKAPKGALPAALEQEVRLVDGARRSLRGVGPEQALEWVARYRAEFPRGALSRDIDFVEIEALYGSGRKGRSRDRARQFLKRYPGDPHAPAVERLLDRDE